MKKGKHGQEEMQHRDPFSGTLIKMYTGGGPQLISTPGLPGVAVDPVQGESFIQQAIAFDLFQRHFIALRSINKNSIHIHSFGLCILILGN